MEEQLSKILSEKQKEVTRLKKGRPFFRKVRREIRADFKASISRKEAVAIIAEIKQASPSQGIIRKDLDPVQIGRIYEQAGAAAVSVVTDGVFFSGNVRWLSDLKKAVSLPLLRKDFIIDESQIEESFLYGADAVLLIARILSGTRLKVLLDLSRGLGMDCLVEIHDAQDLQKAVECGADIIGVNNRDLNTFRVNLSTSAHLISMIPSGTVRVSESGISGKEDILFLRTIGADAALVGTYLLKSGDILAETRALVYCGGAHGKG